MIYAFYGKDDILSNMYEWLDDGDTYITSVEILFQATKAIHFGDRDMAEKILKCNDSKLAKRLGKQVKPFDKDEWDRVKVHVMQLCIKTKMDKCKEFAKRLRELKEQGYTRLSEASPRDTFWGTGYGKDKTTQGLSRGKDVMGDILTAFIK